MTAPARPDPGPSTNLLDVYALVTPATPSSTAECGVRRHASMSRVQGPKRTLEHLELIYGLHTRSYKVGRRVARLQLPVPRYQVCRRPGDPVTGP